MLNRIHDALYGNQLMLIEISITDSKLIALKRYEYAMSYKSSLNGTFVTQWPFYKLIVVP